ncbi:MAG: hypothetical protein KDC85_12945 [Saprospiraceae bacterium]|nr:hypothetical protein [Saprospiraceae bacterium]MCB9324000.1 hypothetical protein [Lewinellaceae bacterium]
MKSKNTISKESLQELAKTYQECHVVIRRINDQKKREPCMPLKLLAKVVEARILLSLIQKEVVLRNQQVPLTQD